MVKFKGSLVFLITLLMVLAFSSVSFAHTTCPIHGTTASCNPRHSSYVENMTTLANNATVGAFAERFSPWYTTQSYVYFQTGSSVNAANLRIYPYTSTQGVVPMRQSSSATQIGYQTQLQSNSGGNYFQARHQVLLSAGSWQSCTRIW